MKTNRIAIMVYVLLAMTGLTLLAQFGRYGSSEAVAFGLSFYDVALLAFCPGAAGLGMSVSQVIKRNALAESDHQNQDGTWLIGLALGLVVALYFVGSIQSNVSSVARVIALCILLGYQAPNIWHSQEVAIRKLIDKKLGEKPEH